MDQDRVDEQQITEIPEEARKALRYLQNHGASISEPIVMNIPDEDEEETIMDDIDDNDSTSIVEGDDIIESDDTTSFHDLF